MASDSVVFLGPSLSQAEASCCFQATYRPPAEAGDVVRAVLALQARAVILIDGVFAKAPAVRHKEILWALDRGVHVFGAASMGALRAAELHPYGMRGSGLIYRWYRLTPMADDDEVAVAMTPSELGAEPLSEALVNIRMTLRLAERHGIIPASIRGMLVETARAIHFVDRTYPNLFARARSSLPSRHAALCERLEVWVGHHAIDQKRADALGLLKRLAEQAGGAPETPPFRPTPFRMTEAWAADLDAAGLYTDEFLSFLGDRRS